MHFIFIINVTCLCGMYISAVCLEDAALIKVISQFLRRNSSQVKAHEDGSFKTIARIAINVK